MGAASLHRCVLSLTSPRPDCVCQVPAEYARAGRSQRPRTKVPRGTGPRGALLCQNVCHKEGCHKHRRLWPRVTDMQVNLPHSRNCRYRLFTFCQLKHSSHRNMRRCVGGPHQADITKRVHGNTICKHCIDSPPRHPAHKTCRRGRHGRRFCNHRCAVCPSTNVNGRSHKERCGMAL